MRSSGVLRLGILGAGAVRGFAIARIVTRSAYRKGGDERGVSSVGEAGKLGIAYCFNRMRLIECDPAHVAREESGFSDWFLMRKTAVAPEAAWFECPTLSRIAHKQRFSVPISAAKLTPPARGSQQINPRENDFIDVVLEKRVYFQTHLVGFSRSLIGSQARLKAKITPIFGSGC
jgi:hypothetical protein